MFHTPVDELKDRIDLDEFQKWKQFGVWDVDPIERLEFYLANILCQTANLNRKKGKSPFKIDEFLLFQDIETPIDKELTFGEMKSLQSHVSMVMRRQKQRRVVSIGKKALEKKKKKTSANP